MRILLIPFFMVMCLGVYAQSPINLKTQTNIDNYIANELNGRLIDTLSTLADTATANTSIGQLVYVNSVDQYWHVQSDGFFYQLETGGGTGVTDGDKGDVTVSSSGAVWNINESAKRARVNYKPSLGVVIGNSTIAAYNGTTAIADFLDVDNSLGDTIISIAVPGHSIDQQESAFLAHPRKLDFDYAVVQIGLNDMNPTSWDSLTLINNYQNLINEMKAANPSIVIIGATMIPAYNRFVNIFATSADDAQDNWEDLNEAIVQGYIKGIDYTVSRHTFLLGDASDRRALASIYDTGDGIHENNDGRELIAQHWQRVLNEAGFLEVTTDSAPTPTSTDAYTISVATPSLYSVGQAVIFRDTVRLATTDSLSALPEMYILSKSGSEITLVGEGSYQAPGHGYNVSKMYFLQSDGSISTTAPNDTIIPVLYAPNDSVLTFFQTRTYYDSIEEFQGESVSASSPAFIEATGISDANITSAIYNLEKDLRDAGLWDKLDVIYPFAGATALAHSYNLKDTSVYKITWIGNVSHTNDGISSASNGYGDTGYNPSTLSKNNATMGVYLRSSSPGATAGILGATEALYSNQFLLFRDSSNYYGNIRRAAGGPVVSDPISAGSFIFTRRSDNDLEGYDDGASFGTESSLVTSSVPNQNMFILANNLGGSPAIYFTDTISFAFVGDPMSDAEILSLHNAIEAYQARMSRSSIGTADNPTTDIPAITSSGGSSGTVLRYSNKATGISVTDIGDYFTGTNQETVNQEVGSVLNILKSNYSFQPFQSNGVDTIPIDTFRTQYFYTNAALNGKTVTGVEYGLETTVTTRSTLPRLLLYRPSTGVYTPFGSATIAVGNSFVTASPSQTIEQGDIIYLETSQAGDNITGIRVNLTIK